MPSLVRIAAAIIHAIVTTQTVLKKFIITTFPLRSMQVFSRGMQQRSTIEDTFYKKMGGS